MEISTMKRLTLTEEALPLKLESCRLISSDLSRSSDLPTPDTDRFPTILHTMHRAALVLHRPSRDFHLLQLALSPNS